MNDRSPAYPRDMIGYGAHPPDPHWPDDAVVAVQFVLNYEEGAERNTLHGDPASETFLSEMFDPAPFTERHMSMESLYEYGSRAGLWRLLNVFERRDLPLTIFGVAKALERNPEAVAAFTELGHEIACHGLWWKSYQEVDERTERADLAEAVAMMIDLTGQHPLGWYTGRDSPNTRRPIVKRREAAFCTTPTRTPTTSPTGLPCRPTTASVSNWWCRTPWRPTT